MDTIAKKHDLTSMTGRLEAIDARLAYLVRQQEKTAELIAEMTPILREVMGTATTKLDELDKKGYFAFGKELVGLGERVVEGFEPDDVRKLGDAVVGILQTISTSSRRGRRSSSREAVVHSRARDHEPSFRLRDPR